MPRLGLDWHESVPVRDELSRTCASAVR
ncbi:hypothetical protein ABZX69_35475 [Streptomyces sp. NPDC004074]